MSEELRALQEPIPHELRVRRRGVSLRVCAGTELEYIYRLGQLRNAITMELNALPAHDGDAVGGAALPRGPAVPANEDGNGGPAGMPAPPTATADDDLFSDGGEDEPDAGPHGSNEGHDGNDRNDGKGEPPSGMEVWDEGDGPAGSFQPGQMRRDH